MVDRLISKFLVPSGQQFSLDDRCTDENMEWNKEWARAELRKVIQDIAFEQHRLMAEARRSLLVVLQGRDASGKDGLVRHVMTGMNPAGVRVTSFKIPAGLEVEHDYLWRCHVAVPRRGEVGVWNRSHYEDILVPRVKNLIDAPAYKKRYRHIRDFEQMLIDEGTQIVKFYLHISHEEQRQRLQKRIDDPESSWKHNPSDLSDREIWPLYQRAYEDVLRETSRPQAPWYVIPSDIKWVRDLAVAKIILEVLQIMDPQLPAPDHGLEGLTIE